MLEVKGLTLKYLKKQHEQILLNQLSFSIASGETYGLIGGSGSGKSLTALAIMQLLPPHITVTSSSQIYFHQQDLLSLPEIQMRTLRGRRIAMIFQEPASSLNPVLPIGRQIEEVLQQHFTLSKKARLDRVTQLLSAVGIQEPHKRRHCYPHQFSGGMKQRVMIAMAIAGEPDFLISDEATTALDVTTQAQILTLLKHLQKTFHMGMLFISHDLGLVKQMARRIGILHAGELVEESDCGAFFEAPKHPYSQALLAANPNLQHSRVLISKKECLTPILSVKQLCVSFPLKSEILRRTIGKITALNNIQFQLSPYRTLAIVGESGSGKTTLGKAIMRLLPSISGEIVYHHQPYTPINKAGLARWQRGIQCIFQDPFASFNPRRLIQDSLLEGLYTQFPQRKFATHLKAITTLLEKVDLPLQSLQRYPYEFSGGQRQRLAIVRALLFEPEILICDEATSALDVLVQAEILKLLQQLQQERGLAYLFITHNMALVSLIADELAVMQAGRIVELGKTIDVLHSPQHPYTQSLLSAVLN